MKTRVIGAAKAKGDYIAFVDSDDYVSMDFYRVLLRKALETDSDITIGKTVWDENGERFIYNYHDSCFQFESLDGEDVQKRFFGQETFCYSWHTIWNKLYKKRLWDAGMCEFLKVNSHVIMTEDIYFSSILFWYANKVCKVNNEAYFYCINENASTNSKHISFEKYKKNIQDIRFVFKTIEQFLKDVNADPEIIKGFDNGKKHYYKMWRNLAKNTFDNQELELANGLLDDFYKNQDLLNVQDEYFFESVKTPWNGGFEYIKEQIMNSEAEYISFDVFDTLIARPFYDPKDLFVLLNKPFMELTNSSVLFSKIRIEGEALAREYYGTNFAYEDITIEEIYHYISDHYRIDMGNMMKMLEYEKKLELRFCHARRSGKELYELSNYIGKKIVLVTDMYIDTDTIIQILKKNGYTFHKEVFVSSQKRCLKYNGNLFKTVLKELGIEANNIIHIGDTWSSDIEGSKKVGIKSIFFPKSIEVFENKIVGCRTNRCADIGKTVIGKNLNYNKIEENIGFRCMSAIVANYYFDNPYRVFNSESDFNIDPYFIGYYLVGMHMLGISKWIHETCVKEHYSNVVFLARDGYLPKIIFDMYSANINPSCNTLYVQISRRAVMPFILKETINLYQMPVEYRAHSPKTIMEILGFMSNIDSDTYQNFDKEFEKPFQNIQEYHEFISLFLDKYYDPQRHAEAKSVVSEYLNNIPNNSITFDMGYSGRIQAAICDAIEKPINALFIHEDYSTSINLKIFKQFGISSFYQYRPEITGLLREHIFSDIKGSCLGYEKKGESVSPVIENKRHNYPDQYVIQSIHNGAVAFTSQFMACFSEFLNEIDFSPEEVSIPFEGFLMNPSEIDMHIFSASYFEDLVFGANCNINIEKFARDILNNKGVVLRKNRSEEPIIHVDDNFQNKMASSDIDRIAEGKKIEDETHKIIDIINKSSQFQRAIAWIVLDFPFFINKLKLNIKRKLGLYKE